MMGMASADNDWKIIEEHQLLQWAKSMPKDSSDWDNPTTDENAKAHHDHAMKKWLNERPTVSGDDWP